MQNEHPPVLLLPLTAFRRMVSDLGIPAPEADLDAARAAAEALLRKALAMGERS